MSSEAWFSILELAEEYGWNPLGTFSADWWLASGEALAGDPSQGDPPAWDGGYSTRVDEARLVMLEDALNLADALQAAILEYEPEPLTRLAPRSLAWLGRHGYGPHARPSLGALTTLMHFCRLGVFTIEKT